MKKYVFTIILILSGLVQASIDQNLGVDPTVDYAALESLGPWDDRNYQLTQADLDYLPQNDQYLANVPLFFKVIVRKEHPNYGEFYPRSTLQAFQMQYGGILKDGIWHKEGLGIGYHKGSNVWGKTSIDSIKVTAQTETSLATGVSGNEVAIECNPTNKNNCVAGSNQSGGQSMYYSSDAGVTWTFSQTNASSCCDPTIDWSSDGSIVYQADLSGGSIGVRWTRSLDQGVTWEPMKVITSSGSDKEFIHVDRSSASPYKDNLYITWHDGNVMQFARSTDMGVTMSTPMAFGSEPTGIGSDLTTDTDGNIYYFYPSLNGSGIRLLKSIDGGASFATGIQVAPLNDTFDFPIPAMESRNVFIYTSADVDLNTNAIYVAWTDQTDDSTNSGASGNHAWIQVAKSTDAGTSWNLCTNPHDISDTLMGTPIDRFHPWLKVGENGVVHIGYYDTRHSTNRTGVDFFYTSSLDGCATWEPEERYTTETSVNINNGQEWGDYNGLSVVLDKIAASFTDNRPSIGQTAMIASGPNLFSNPSFTLSTSNNNIEVCANDSGVMGDVSISVNQSYNNGVTLNPTTVPGFISNINFTTNPISPTPGATNFTFDADGTGTTGIYPLVIQGTGDEELPIVGTITKNLSFNIQYSAGTTSASTLSAPADAAIDVAVAPTFSWSSDANATSYHLLVATDAAFTNVIVDETLTTTSYVASGLSGATVYYWKVSTQSVCNGNDVESNVFSFTTVAVYCATTPVSIPDNTAAGVDLTIPISSPNDLASLTVSVKANHTWVGDLIFTLTHGATSIDLMNRPGAPASTNGCSANDVDVIFDDNSVVPVEDECATPIAIFGTLAPDMPLSTFAGQAFAGNWVLNVSDNVGADTGNVTEFCIVPTLVPSIPEITVTKTATLTTDTLFIGEADLNDVITFNVSVENTGDVVLDTLVVNDTMAGALTCMPTALAPAEVATCTAYTYTVLQTDIDMGGTIDNTAMATMTNPSDSSTYMHSATTQTPINQALFKDGFE